MPRDGFGTAHPPVEGARRRRHGYTLTELMVVVALISSAGLVAYPRFHDLREAGVSRARARGAVLALKAAQQRAAALNRPVVAFLPDESRLAFYADLDRDGEADLPHEARAARFPGSVPTSGFPSFELGGGRSVEPLGLPVGDRGHPQVTLSADGTASSGGTLRITDRRGVTYDVEIRPTGAVHLSRRTGV